MVKEEIFSILSALVGGARYGVKIRFPHALVMTLLFRQDLSSQEKLKMIIELACQHAFSLASFATIYKFVLFLLKISHQKLVMAFGAKSVEGKHAVWKVIGRVLSTRLGILVDVQLPDEQMPVQYTTRAPPGYPERIHHAFLAGAVGGYFVWGRYNSLNQQIIFYLTSRVLLGVWKRLIQLMHTFDTENGPVGTTNENWTFSVVAALVWATVMALWEESPDVLHPSLKKSMDEIYRYRIDEAPLTMDYGLC